MWICTYHPLYSGSDKKGEKLPREGFTGAADITSVEAHFSRSLKIRMGVADCLDSLARRGETGEPVQFESLEDVASFAGFYVFESGWDLRPASTEATRRWVKQYTLPSAFFELAEILRGGYVVQYRSEAMKRLLRRMVANHRPRKRRKGKSREN